MVKLESHQNHPTTLIAYVPLSTNLILFMFHVHEITRFLMPCRAMGVVIWRYDGLGSERKASIEIK